MAEQPVASQSAGSSGVERDYGPIFGILILGLLFVFYVPQFAKCPACRGWSSVTRGFEQGLQGLNKSPTRGVLCSMCRDDGKVTIVYRVLDDLGNIPLRDER